MAKKQEMGRGKKRCAVCGEIVGARVQECPKCNTAFPTKTKKVTKDNIPDLEDGISIVGEIGGMAKVEKMIEAARTAQEGLAELGGLAGAESILAKMKELAKLVK